MVSNSDFVVSSVRKGIDMDLKGSKTEANLQTAFAGESQARNKYSFFEKQALKEGYMQIAGIFNETANNEMAHAKIWYKTLNGPIKDTIENLVLAAAGEHYEWTEMYKGFAEVAKEEGFNDIAFKFEMVGHIEKEHEARYNELHKRMKEGTTFKRDEVTTWHCRNCGHLHVGDSAPEKCPVCGDPQTEFELLARNY